MSDVVTAQQPAEGNAPAAAESTIISGVAPPVDGGQIPEQAAAPPAADTFDWRAAMAGGDEKALKRFERYADPAAAGRAFLELERERREGVLPKPKSDWGDEQWGKFYAELGRPEAPDKYEIQVQVADDAPAGAQGMIEARLQDVRQAAFDAGLTPQQWAKLSQYVHTSVSGELAAAQSEARAYQQEVVQQLRSEWGEGYKENIEWANAALNEFSRETGFDAQSMLGLTVMVDGKQVKLGDYAPFIKLATAVGRRFADDPNFLDVKTGMADSVGSMQQRLDQLIELAKTNSRAYDEQRGEVERLANAIARAKSLNRAA